MNMHKEEIKEFLRNKRGYLKEGGKRLRKVLDRKGFTTTIKDCKAAIREVLAEIKVKPVTNDNDKPKILFYDIETAYGIAKVWRPGWKVRVSYDNFITDPQIICISWKWSDSDEVHTVNWGIDSQDDESLVKLFVEELNKADFIVAHNGDKFDLPWIRTRALKHGVPMYPKYSAVDTLKISRYEHNFPSNRLDDLGEYLELGRKIKVPYELWDRVILDKEQKALDEMIEYCEQDVRLLEKVYYKLAEMTLPKVHAGTMNGKTKQTSPYNGGTNFEMVKKTTTKAGTIKWLMRDLDENKFFEMSNTAYNKYLETYK